MCRIHVIENERALDMETRIKEPYTCEKRTKEPDVRDRELQKRPTKEIYKRDLQKRPANLRQNRCM